MSSALRNALPLIVATTLLASCGGGGGGSLTPATSASTTTIAPGQGTLALTIAIPHPAAASVSKRSAAYISSSTRSIAITLTQTGAAAVHETVGLTPSTNPNCTTVGSTTTCAITIGLAAGSFTATFATYDGPVVSGAATGNLLSQGQSIPVTVTAGQTNTVTATLDGVPTSITIAPSSNSTITGTQSGGFSVPYSAQGLTIEALDADNNVILGAGAPTFTVTATASKFTVTQPSVGSPNQITLAAAAGGSGTLSVTAAPPDGGFSCSTSGVVCTASATISTGPHTLFVSNQSNVTVYQSTDNLTWTLIATKSYPESPAFQNAIAVAPNGTLFIAALGFGGAAISAIAAPYTGSATTISTDVQEPTLMAATPTNELLVADQYHLDGYAAPYTGTPSRTNLPATYETFGLAVDAAGDAIVSTPAGTWLYSSPYTSVTTTINGSIGGGITLDSSGNLFVGNYQGGNEVLEYAPPYTGSPVTVTVPGEGGTNSPVSLAVDANGNLWVANEYAGSCPCNTYIFEYAPPFSSTSTPIFSQEIDEPVVAADTAGDVIVPTASNTLSIENASGTSVGTITTSINDPRALIYVK